MRLLQDTQKQLATHLQLDLVPLDHMELKEMILCWHSVGFEESRIEEATVLSRNSDVQMGGDVARREGVVKTISFIGLIGRCLQVVEKMVVERIQKTIGVAWRTDRLSSATLCRMKKVGLRMRSVGMYKAWGS